MNILFLPAWYPNKEDSMLGLFISNHAKCVAINNNVFVIAAISSLKIAKTFEIEINKESNLVEILVYYKKNKSPLTSYFINLYRFFKAYIKAYKYLTTNYSTPDLCHVNVLTRAGIPAIFLKFFYKIPYVITEHWSRYFSFNDSYKGFFRKLLTNFIVKNSLGISCVSNSLKIAMQEKGISHKNWLIIPNCIDTNSFTLENTDKNENIIRCFHISCFEEKSKNMSGIVKAFHLALKQNPNLELYMIGNGADWKKTKQLSDELKIGDKIIFTDTLIGDELLKTMHKCQFSIIFSNYETFSIVIPESLACGIPVIATNINAIPEVLPEEFGILIPPKNINILANAIIEMSEKHNKYNKINMNKYVVKNFDKQAVAIMFNTFYTNALSKNS